MAFTTQALETTFTVGADILANRQVPFTFPVSEAAQVSVVYNGADVPRTAFDVTVDLNRRGGTITFRTTVETGSPITLVSGQTGRIYRDTEVRRRTSFPLSGAVQGAAVERLAEHTNQVTQELAARVETHRTIVEGDDAFVRPSQLPALVRANQRTDDEVKDLVVNTLQGGEGHADSDLDWAGTRDDLHGELRRERVNLGHMAKDPSDPSKLEDAAGWRSAIEVPPAVDTGPLSDRITDLESFEEAIRRDDVLGTASILMSQANIAYAMGTQSNPVRLPARDESTTVTFRVTEVGEPDAEHTFRIAQLWDAGSVTGDGGSLTTANGVELTNEDTGGDHRFRFGVDTQGDLFFAGDTGTAGPRFGVTATLHTLRAGLSVRDSDGTTALGRDHTLDTLREGTGIDFSRTGDTLTIAATATGGTGDASELTPVTTLPTTPTPAIGTLANRSGELWRYVESSVDGNTYHGVVAARSNSFIGDDRFQWKEGPPAEIELRIPQSINTSPPSTIYIELIIPGHDGIYSESSLTRAASVSGTPPEWVYTHTPGEPAYDSEPQSVYLGRPFTVRAYENARKTGSVTLVSPSDDKWVVADAPDIDITDFEHRRAGSYTTSASEVQRSGPFVPAGANTADWAMPASRWDRSQVININSSMTGMSESNPFIVSVPGSANDVSHLNIIFNAAGSRFFLKVMTAEALTRFGRSRTRGTVQMRGGQICDIVRLGTNRLGCLVLETRLATETVAGLVEKATQAELAAGTPDRYPDAAEIRALVPRLVVQEMQEASVGLNVASTGTATFRPGDPVALIPEGETAQFALAENERGEFHIELDFSLTSPSAPNPPTVDNWSLDGSATGVRSRTVPNITFASELLQESAWGGTTDDMRDNGEEIARVMVYNTGTLQGTAIYTLTRTATRQVGIFARWLPSAGSTGIVLACEARTSFTRTDAPVQAGGSSYTQHTSLDTLPTSGMTVGDLHQVTQGSGVTASVTRFVAVSATQLKCVGGVTEDLINRNVGTPQGGTGGNPLAVTTARQWRRIPVSATGTTAPWATWDYRFPIMLVSLGGRNNTGGPWNLDSTWYAIDTNAIQGLTAASTGGTQATGQFIEVGRVIGVTNTNQPIWRVVAFGRTATNEILVNLHSTTLQAFPLRIRGACA